MTDAPLQPPQPAPRILVDADACPRDIRDMILRNAVRRRIKAIFVANQYLRLPEFGDVECVVVPAGADEADKHIHAVACGTDAVVTADIPLASLLVDKGVAVLSPRGFEWNAANIGEHVATRNLMEQLRSAGMITGGPPEMSKNDVSRFANALDRVLTRLSRPAPGRVTPDGDARRPTAE